MRCHEKDLKKKKIDWCRFVFFSEGTHLTHTCFGKKDAAGYTMKKHA